jgi:hypothetical protein
MNEDNREVLEYLRLSEADHNLASLAFSLIAASAPFAIVAIFVSVYWLFFA